MHEDDPDGEADRLVAATIYLMSCHARSRCPRLACLVQCHLKSLGRHAQATEHVRHTARKLAAAWEAIRRYDELRATSGIAAFGRGPLH